MQSISYTKITSRIIFWIRKVLSTYHHCLSSNHHENIVMTNKWPLLWNLFGEIRYSYDNSENDNILFSFSIIPHFYHVNTLVHVDIDQNCSKWKTRKTSSVFFFYKYGKFWSIVPGIFVSKKLSFPELFPGKRTI